MAKLSEELFGLVQMFFFNLEILQLKVYDKHVCLRIEYIFVRKLCNRGCTSKYQKDYFKKARNVNKVVFDYFSNATLPHI